MIRKRALSVALSTALCLSPVLSSAALEVVVTPSRTAEKPQNTPGYVAVLDRQQLADSGARTIAEALRGIGSTIVRDLFGDGSRTSVGLRGFSETASHNTLVLIDGRELNNSDSSSPEWSTISLENVERIEVFEGSAGALYGDKAVGGVINIITRAPQDLSGRVQVGRGSYNRRMLQAEVQDRFDSGLNYRVFVEDRKADNYRDNNELEYGSYQGRLGFSGDRLEAYLEAGQVIENQETPGALTQADVAADRRQSLAPFVDDFSDTETQFTRGVLKYQVSDTWRFESDISVEKAESDFRISSSFGAATSDSFLKREQKSFSPRYIGKWETNRGTSRITLGGDFSMVDYSIRSPFGTTQTERESEAIFAQGLIPVVDRWSITAGARHADVDDVIDQGMGGQAYEYDSDVAELGVNFVASDQARLYLRADQNFRVATTDEASFTSPGVTQLNPQEGVSYEFGGDFLFDDIQYGVNLYQLDLEDEIAYDPTAPGLFGPGANVNLDETRRQGLIVSSTIPLTQMLQLSLNYHRVEAEFRSGGLKGNQVSGVPEESARLSLDIEPLEALTIYTEAVYTGQQYVSGDNTNTLAKRASYTLFNVAARYQMQEWAFGARINNVGDKEYNASENSFGGIQPAAGTNGWLTAEYRF
ncbi:TonB-dependent receptor, plug [gamma proteobacterium HTCC5015]|nr:TonB-dependent receptor, plug [gamma proteobacterium HTCC5015]